MSDVDIPDIDLPDDDLPEEEIPESDEYHSSDDDESYENYEQHRNNNPTFKANLYTKKELSAKVKEADNQIQYYKSQELAHAKRAHGIYEKSELSSVREAHRNVEKWTAIKRRWENETPKDK